MRTKFEEDVVEETTDTVVEETAPDIHEQFVSILVNMGLSADQAEAVHQMALDLIDAGGAEEVAEPEVVTETTEETTLSKMSKSKNTPVDVERLVRRVEFLSRQVRKLRETPGATRLTRAPRLEEVQTIDYSEGQPASKKLAFTMMSQLLNK
jgi:hypothetical protein